MRFTWSRAALAAAICVYVGLMIGWFLWHPRPQPAEGDAIARVLPKSGAAVLERDPSAEVSKPLKAAIKESRGKVERVVRLTITPKPISAPDTAAPSAPHPPEAEEPERPVPGCSCAPVQVDLAIVRMKDETRRVLALGAHGEEIAGIDVPFKLPAQRAEPRWSALAMYGPDGYGGGGTRRVGPIELGAAAINFRSEVAYFAVAQIRFGR